MKTQQAEATLNPAGGLPPGLRRNLEEELRNFGVDVTPEQFVKNMGLQFTKVAPGMYLAQALPRG